MRFYTAGLLSKWGFQDGDVIDDLLWDALGNLTNAVEHFEHKVLIEVLKLHVIPKIEQTIEFQEICTIHNPARAKTVNGKTVDWYNENPEIKLTPEYVEVDDAVIIEIAKKL